MIIHMSVARRLPVCVLLAMPMVARAQESATAQLKTASVDNTATLVGVSSEVTELRQQSAATGAGDKWQILWLRQYISERIMAASLEVDAVVAQIDNEIARASEIRSYLSDRRDRAVTRANLLSVVVGGGLSATSSALQLSSTLNKPAAGVGVGAGALSAGLGIVGIYAQKGGRRQFDFQSNMLAQFFDRPVLPDSEYPATVWAFLNQAPASSDASGLTRKQQLVQTWVDVKRIDSITSVDKIDRLTSQPSEQRKLSIDDFEDRAAMLQDVRARISYLKRDLRALLTSLPSMGR